MKDRIKAIRAKLKLTQAKFAERIGMTKSGISLIENGTRNPSETVILSICREFHVSAQYLRDGDGAMFLEPLDDADLVDQVMAGENEYAKHLLITIVKAGEKDKGWDVLKAALDALKEAGL